VRLPPSLGRTTKHSYWHQGWNGGNGSLQRQAALERVNAKQLPEEAMVLDGVRRCLEIARQLLDLMDKGETALVLIRAGS
jgi:hypothetical protein